MTTVYVWLPGQSSAYGHCSVRTSDRYLSWWPESDMFGGKPTFAESYDEDCGLMAGQSKKNQKSTNSSENQPRTADHQVAIGKLDEKKMNEYVDEVKNGKEDEYHLINKNCASMVSHAILLGAVFLIEKMTLWEKTKIVGRCYHPDNWASVLYGGVAVYRGENFFWTPKAVLRLAEVIKVAAK